MKCTYCGGTEFYEGPSGGLSTNILCANEKCRHWFNYMGVIDKLEDLNRVEPTDEEREAERIAKQAERDAAPDKFYEEGAEIYRKGGSAKECLESAPDWHGVNGSDLYRLAGFVDALSADKDRKPLLKKQQSME